MRSPCGRGCSERSDPVGCLSVYCQYSDDMPDADLALWVLEVEEGQISVAHARRLAKAYLAAIGKESA